MHLKGEITRLREKLRLEEKSGAATQQQVRHLYGRLDILQGKTKVNGPLLKVAEACLALQQQLVLIPPSCCY